MPKKFDDMVKAIQDSGKSEQEAYAIATSQWKKSHNGKAPMHEDRELFNAEDMLKYNPETNSLASPEDERHVHELGREVADRYSDAIYSLAKDSLLNQLRDKSYDVTSEAEDEGYEDAEELIEETDEFRELVTDLCHEFLLGMNDAWPFPV